MSRTMILLIAVILAGGAALSAAGEPSPRDVIFRAADEYAEVLMQEPPAGLDRGEIAMAFGWIYLNGMLGEPSLDKAEQYLEMALNAGLPEAGVVLGAIFLEEGAGRDIPRAVQYYQRAAEGGSVDAHRTLGLLYTDGEAGLTADPVRGREHLLEAARRGSDAALARLAPELGRNGLPERAEEIIDPELAAVARARANQVPRATAIVFDLLEKRLGEMESVLATVDPMDPYAALSRLRPEEQEAYWELLETAVVQACREVIASQPDRAAAGDAALIIGVLNHLGLVYGATSERALEYMELAEDHGVLEAMVTLGDLYLGLTPAEDQAPAVEVDVVKGLAYLERAAIAGSPDALRLLGLVYAEGLAGVEPDDDRAEEYFLAAARHGDAVALARLEPLFERTTAWLEANPGETADRPGGADMAVDPDLRQAAERRSERLGDTARMVNAEIARRTREAMMAREPETTAPGND
ncbi:MAG: hypothetical protein LIP77_04475 [Planctomycetes bacterium]|nr:hypothetical protein [Planctomycetota bacterium]